MSDGPAKDDPTANKTFAERQSKSAFEPNARQRDILRDRSRRSLDFDPDRPLTIADVEALLRVYFENDPHRQNVEHETKRIYRALQNDDERLDRVDRRMDAAMEILRQLSTTPDPVTKKVVEEQRDQIVGVQAMAIDAHKRCGDVQTQINGLDKRLEALVASVGAHYGQYDSHRAIYGAQFDEFASTLRKADDRFLGLAERTETALESMKTVFKAFTPQYERAPQHVAAQHAEPQGEAALRQEAAEVRTVDDRADVIVRANKLRIEDAGPVGAGTDPPGNAISDVVLKAYERLVTADPRNLPEMTRVSTVELRAIVGELIRFRKYYGAWPVR
jgi:hypothetical protein